MIFSFLEFYLLAFVCFWSLIYTSVSCKKQKEQLQWQVAVTVLLHWSLIHSFLQHAMRLFNTLTSTFLAVQFCTIFTHSTLYNMHCTEFLSFYWYLSIYASWSLRNKGVNNMTSSASKVFILAAMCSTYLHIQSGLSNSIRFMATCQTCLTFIFL